MELECQPARLPICFRKRAAKPHGKRRASAVPGCLHLCKEMAETMAGNLQQQVKREKEVQFLFG